MTATIVTAATAPATALDREWIARHIPHRGGMCLLDRVLEWDPTFVRCSATSHRDLTNPLRAHGRLGAACGIEYAAQAMAVHGALVGSIGTNEPALPPGHGMLASMRGVVIEVDRLDDIEGDLIIVAQRQSGDAQAIGYTFDVSASGRSLLSGRATVVLGASQATLVHGASQATAALGASQATAARGASQQK